MALTLSQRKALRALRDRHLECPVHTAFSSLSLGSGISATLRQLSSLGLVSISQAGKVYKRDFFTITEAGQTMAQDLRL